MIAVVQGGHESEAEISRMTSKSFQEALDKLKLPYQVVEYDQNFQKSLEVIDPTLCLLALHGKLGEDGVVQALLEELKIPYTGSGVKASSLAFNKVKSLSRAKELGVPILPHFMCTKEAPLTPPQIEVIKSWSSGFVVKPSESGSSRGVVLCDDIKDLEPALTEAFRWDETAVVEKRLKGREITVSLFEDRAFEPIEIRPKTGFYDMKNKYTKGATDYLIPAPISLNLKQNCQKDSLKVYRDFNLKTYSRVDFLISEDGEEHYFMEVNTLPGCTETSLLPKALAFEGIPFTQLIQSLVDSAGLEKA